eukprot:TRINITY_DN1399_c0_g2_i8.p1 TRINITY_DN1399_c0_g2~~TRINITY_DN1399_c0_g2_i8.p1  ORF type:complete len:135 (+),score=27.57 TRINITY_DN1399_c0_g2_i8:142-546(+)
MSGNNRDTTAPEVQVSTWENIQTTLDSANKYCYEAREAIIDRFVDPTTHFVRKAPGILYRFKRHHVLSSDFTSRMYLHGTLNALVFFLSLRKNRNIFYSVRNTFISYYGLGIFLVPELLAPYLSGIPANTPRRS